MIPISSRSSAVATAFLLLFILAGLTDINTITPLLVSMIGLGVGSTTRSSSSPASGSCCTRARAGRRRGRGGRLSGRAVLFAGMTVAISVTGLAFFGLDFVTKLGIGSALGVLTTVLIANSLLIAVLASSGTRSTG